MRRRSTLALVPALFLAAVSFSAADAPQSTRSPAPAFSVRKYSDGNSVSLAALRGKVVLLYFFFPS